MGLLANNPQLMQNAAPAQPQPPAPDMRTQLAAEEARLRAQAAQQQQMMPTAPAQTQSVVDAWARIERHGRGTPALGGNAAQAIASARGWQLQVGGGYAGTGQLGGIQLTEAAHIFQLAAELDGQTAPPQPPPVQYNLATQQYATQGVPLTQPAPINAAQAGGILPPGAPESMPQLAVQQPKPETGPQGQPLSGPDAYTAAQIPAPAPKAPRGPRKPKTQDTAPNLGAPPEATAAVAAPAPPPPAQPAAPASQVPPVSASASQESPLVGLVVLINARLDGRPTKSLAPYVDYINGELAKRYCVNADGSPGLQDIRCAPKDSPLAFGGWKGAVREVVKAEPPPADFYHLDTFMDDLNEAVADALRSVCSKTGGVFVRGVR